MDFINKAYAQLADLFKSMTPGARITSALLLVVVVVSVAYLFNQHIAGPDDYLMGGEPFSASQLNAMQAAFGKAGLDGYQADGTRIKVPHGQQAKYMAALADANALPADFGDYLQKAVTTNGFSMVGSAQQEAAIKIAKQRELQNIINYMDGVEKASVQIDEKTSRGGFPQPKTTLTAAVSIRSKGNQPLEESLVRGVRYLVAGSVAGMKPEAVTVVDGRTGQPYPGNGGDDNKSGGLLDKYAEMRRYHEQRFQKNISDLLSFVPGVVVRTSVDLDPEILHEENSTEYDNKAVAFESRENTLTKTNEGGSPGGRPGVAAQGGVNQPATVTAAAAMKNNEETSQTEQRKAVPTTQTRTVREGRTPKRVTVSVVIPNTYYEEIWRKQNATPEGQPEKKPDAAALADVEKTENKKIQELIVPLLPAAPDPALQVAIMTFYPSNNIAAVPEPTLQETAVAWLGQNWSAVGMGCLALLSLTMLRSMIKSTPATPPSVSSTPAPMETPSTLALVTEDEPQEPVENTARQRLKRHSATGPSLRDELADIVREDPDAAVSILRTWIGTTS
jgi:flagellar M-ring protein FliF